MAETAAPSSTPVSPFPPNYPQSLPQEYLSKTLEELERITYIEGVPFHQIFSMRSLGGGREGYERNLKKMKDFVAKIGEDLNLSPESIKDCLPTLEKIEDSPQEELF